MSCGSPEFPAERTKTHSGTFWEVVDHGGGGGGGREERESQRTRLLLSAETEKPQSVPFNFWEVGPSCMDLTAAAQQSLDLRETGMSLFPELCGCWVREPVANLKEETISW